MCSCVFMCVHVCMCVCLQDLFLMERFAVDCQGCREGERVPLHRGEEGQVGNTRCTLTAKPVSPLVSSSTDPRPVSLHLAISFACPGRLSSEREEEEEGQGCKGKRRKTCSNQEEGGPYSLRQHGPRPLWLGQVSTRAKDRVVECEYECE